MKLCREGRHITFHSSQALLEKLMDQTWFLLYPSLHFSPHYMGKFIQFHWSQFILRKQYWVSMRVYSKRIISGIYKRTLPHIYLNFICFFSNILKAFFYFAGSKIDMLENCFLIVSGNKFFRESGFLFHSCAYDPLFRQHV